MARSEPRLAERMAERYRRRHPDYVDAGKRLVSEAATIPLGAAVRPSLLPAEVPGIAGMLMSGLGLIQRTRSANESILYFKRRYPLLLSGPARYVVPPGIWTFGLTGFESVPVAAVRAAGVGNLSWVWVVVPEKVPGLVKVTNAGASRVVLYLWAEPEGQNSGVDRPRR